MNKYRNKKTIVDDITFDSKREALRYIQLKAKHAAGHISDFKRQVRFTFEVNGNLVRHTKSKRPLTYVLDFQYVDLAGVTHYEDVKGVRTPEYKIKAALMKACHNIEIEEI